MTALREGVQIDHYLVEEIFADNRGGFAQVVTARRKTPNNDGEWVAMKVAKPNDRRDGDTYDRALINEVETLRRLKHPSIVRMYPIQVGDHHFSFMARATQLDGQPWYFIMEHLAGGSVEQLIKEQGALSPELAVEICQQICMALDYIHSQGYAHLDIKTNNIMLRQPLVAHTRPEAVLIDFGAAQKDVRRAEVEAGALIYLPPERVEIMIGEKPPETVTDKSAADMYAVGVSLYRMLTGELPFRGRRSQVTTAILTETPTRPLHVNEAIKNYRELDDLVMQLLEKRPERRPAAEDVVTKLDQIIPPPRFRNQTSAPASMRRQGANRWKLAAAALATVVVLETAFIFLADRITAAPTVSTPPTTTPTQIVRPTATQVVTTIAPPTPAPPIATSAPANGGGLEPQPDNTGSVTPTSSRTKTVPDSTPTIAPTNTPRPPTPTPRPPTATPQS